MRFAIYGVHDNRDSSGKGGKGSIRKKRRICRYTQRHSERIFRDKESSGRKCRFDLLGQSNTAVENAKCQKRKITVILSAIGGIAGLMAQLGTFLIRAVLVLSGWGITPGVLIVFMELSAAVINPIRNMPELLANRKAALALVDKMASSLESNIRDE